jgi:hypothetical protein
MRAPGLKIVRVVLWLWLAWLVAGNLFLNTALGPGVVNRKPERFQLHWSHGVTLYPGHAWLWNVQARGHVRHTVWEAQAARADGRVALWPLFARRLTIPSALAHEVHVRIDRVEEDMAPPDSRPGGWWISLDDLGTETLRSLAYRSLRLDGTGVAHFGVRKQLRGGALAIPRATLRMEDGALFDDDLQWSSHVDIDGGFQLPEHRREDAPGLERLKLARAQLKLAARTPGLVVALDKAGNWAADVTRLDPGGTAEDHGELRIDMALADGALQPGGSLTLALPLDAIDADGADRSGQAGLVLAVDPDRLHLSARLPPPPGDGGHVDADLYLAGRELPLPSRNSWAGSLQRLSGNVDLDWQFQSLHWFAPLFARAEWLNLDGAGRVQADVRIAEGHLANGSTLGVPAVAARIDVLDNRFTGTAKAQGRIEEHDGKQRTRLELQVESFRMSPVDAPDTTAVTGRNLRLDVTAAGALADMGKSMQARLRFDDARIPDLRYYNRFLPGRGMQFLGGQGRITGDLTLDAAGEVAQGRIGMDARGTRLSIGELDVSGDLSIRTRLRRGDLAARRFVLEGTELDLTRLQQTGKERARDRDWWARATVPRGELVWGRPLQLSADVEARARDIGLLLSLFAHERDYPRWVFNLVDAGEAQLTTRFHLGGGAMTLDPLQARNNRFDVKARLRIADRQPLGHLLLGWGRLSLGLELARGERDWHLRKAADWFEGGRLP